MKYIISYEFVRKKADNANNPSNYLNKKILLFSASLNLNE